MKKLSPVCFSQLVSVTLPICPVFCRVATKGTDTPWSVEVAQPKRLRLIIRVASEHLKFIANSCVRTAMGD
jgi:hypothetical protein